MSTVDRPAPRVLVTGMSGTGKSSVVAQIRARGFRAADVDEPAWSQYVDAPVGTGLTTPPGAREWVWRLDRVGSLLDDAGDGPLVLSGCASNQGALRDRFTHVVLLTAPRDVVIERIRSRTTNAFGKTPEELAQVLADTDEVEPLLRRTATLVVDTSAPLPAVVDAVLAHAGLPLRPG